MMELFIETIIGLKPIPNN